MTSHLKKIGKVFLMTSVIVIVALTVYELLSSPINDRTIGGLLDAALIHDNMAMFAFSRGGVLFASSERPGEVMRSSLLDDALHEMTRIVISPGDRQNTLLIIVASSKKDDSRKVLVYDWANAQIVTMLHLNASVANLDRNGKWIYSGCVDGTVCVHALNGTASIYQDSTCSSPVRVIAQGQGNDILACHENGQMFVHDVNSGDVNMVEGNISGVTHAQYVNDAIWLISHNGGVSSLRNEAGKLIVQRVYEGSLVLHISMLPDAREAFFVAQQGQSVNSMVFSYGSGSNQLLCRFRIENINAVYNIDVSAEDLIVLLARTASGEYKIIKYSEQGQIVSSAVVLPASDTQIEDEHRTVWGHIRDFVLRKE